MTRSAFGGAAALLFGAVPAMAQTPMSMLESFGQRANDVLPLTWGLIWLAAGVVVIISLLVIFGIILRPKFEHMDLDGHLPVTRAGGPAGIRWMYIGLALTTVTLAIYVTWTLVTMAAIDEPASSADFEIEVTGHQWWWEVRYLDPSNPSQEFVTANEIHIPVGTPVKFRLASADVIHSFWVPALGGKTDLIPGQVNRTWLEADRAGVYRGQCAEYCGKQHAHMVLRVFADEPDAFARWRDNQLAAAKTPEVAWAQQGQRQFILRCGACHAVRGTDAGGQVGPDLSHLMTRTTLAAGMIPNNMAYLSAWISNPDHIKPGTKMPNPELSGSELDAIRTYLATLD